MSVPLCSSCLPRLRGCLSVFHMYLTRLQPPSHSHKLFLASAPHHFILIRVYRPGLKKHHLNISLRFGLPQSSFIELVLTVSLYSIIYYCLDSHFSFVILCIQHTIVFSVMSFIIDVSFWGRKCPIVNNVSVKLTSV